MRKLLFPSMLLLTFTVSAAVDYSSCVSAQPGLYGRLNNDGQILPIPGEKVSITKNEDGSENVLFTQPNGVKFGFNLKRDKEDRITSISNERDYSSLTKKERNDLLMREATLLAFDSQGTCQGQGGGSWDENGYGGGWSVHSRECASVRVWNPELKSYVPADYNIINKNNFSKFKFDRSYTWKEFEEMRKYDKKRWKADEKVVKAYAKSLEQTGWAAPTGTVTSFDFKDGKCFVKKVEDLLVIGKTGAKVYAPKYDHEECSRMKPIFEKYDDKLHQCKLDNFQASNEILYASMNIKPEEVLAGSPVDMDINFSGIHKGTTFERKRHMCLLYNQDFPVRDNDLPGLKSSTATKQ